jgi:hypothetical protein
LDRLQSTTWGEVIWWLKLAGCTALGAGVFEKLEEHWMAFRGYVVSVVFVTFKFYRVIVFTFQLACSFLHILFGSLDQSCHSALSSLRIFGCCTDQISSFRENEESRPDRIERNADSRHLKRLRREDNHGRMERIVQEQKEERQKIKDRLWEQMITERIERLQTKKKSNALRKEQIMEH